jgi:hypothetical protein
MPDQDGTGRLRECPPARTIARCSPLISRSNKYRIHRNPLTPSLSPGGERGQIITMESAVVVQPTSSTQAVSSRQAVSGGGDFGGRLEKSAWSRSA